MPSWPSTALIKAGSARSMRKWSPKISPTCSRSFRSERDRKSTRLNSSHGYIPYAVFFLEKQDDPLLDDGESADAELVPSTPAPHCPAARSSTCPRRCASTSRCLDPHEQ